ncbi:MAG: helicase-related protein [Bacillota bacterium]
MAENNSNCVEVIETIQDHLPALYFAFGRGRTEMLAEELGRAFDFLTGRERQAVNRAIRQAEESYPGLFTLRRQNLRRLLLQGIGYHHAGLPPVLKELVERLYEERLLYVLFCTETFALGVNFPAASTVFDSCRKWDGREFRGLMNREFFQMAGRAGRRGYDRVGHVYVRIDEKYPEQTGFYNELDVEPVRGRLAISPNTVLSLLYWKTDEEIKRFLAQNLAVYQNNREIWQLRRELKTLAEKEKQLAVCFCPEKDTPACQLHRLALKRELNHLKRRKYRHRPGARERREELRKLLSAGRKDCNYNSCAEAEKKLKGFAERKTYLTARIENLQKNSRDFVLEFENVWRLLEELGYVRGRELLARGKFALELHVQEILVTELVFSGILLEASPEEAAAILAGIDYQPGRDEWVERCPFSLEHVVHLRKFLLRSGVPEYMCVWSHLPAALAAAWYRGASFEELMQKCNLEEGDIFSILRREIDLLRQIERAAGKDAYLADFVRAIRQTLDREEVALVGV